MSPDTRMRAAFAKAVDAGMGPAPPERYWHNYYHDTDDNHGVSLPELKKSTNLKLHLKPGVQDVWQNLDSGSTL